MKQKEVEKERHQALGLKTQKGPRAETTGSMMDKCSPSLTTGKDSLGLMGW